MRDLVDVDDINDGRDGRIGDAPGDRGERRRRVWVPRAATGRGDDAGSACPALEEPAAEDLLQPTNGVGQRRLGDVVLPGGRTERTGPGNRPSIAQALGTESIIHASSLRTLANGPDPRPSLNHRESGRPRTGQPNTDPRRSRAPPPAPTDERADHPCR